MRLAVRGIHKSFEKTRVLSDVAFDVRPGSLHALLGENGAGKSTLMKIVAGALAADSGQMLLDGKAYAPSDPLSARRQGVAIVYQELSVCPDLTVAENIVLGVEPNRAGFVSAREMKERVSRALEPLTREREALNPEARAGDLSTADQQLVEIARALAHRAPRLLILDEPTSSLGAADVDRLFETLRELRDAGLSILYISHFLEEVRRIADDYTVLRDGKTVKAGAVADTTNDELVLSMAGTSVHTLERSEREKGEQLLVLENLAGKRLPLSASLTLSRGDVLGIAGLVGSGRTELMRAIFGLDPVVKGLVKVKALAGPKNPRRRLAEGVGLLSEDRKNEGLATELSLAENLTLSRLAPLRRFGLLSLKAEREATQRWIDKLGVRCRGPDQRMAELSGGNQQKLAIARLLYHDVDVFLLDEPTRGIDVRSRGEVHKLIDELAVAGKAVLIVSSYLPELLAVCDRIAVMRRGQLSPARPAAGLTEHEILLEATTQEGKFA